MYSKINSIIANID